MKVFVRVLAAALLLGTALASISEPVIRSRNVNGGIIYEKMYSIALNTQYHLIANASLDGHDWNHAKPIYDLRFTKAQYLSSPLFGAALSIAIDFTCGPATGRYGVGVSLVTNETIGSFEAFTPPGFVTSCPLGGWFYDPNNAVTQAYFDIEIDSTVAVCPFTLTLNTQPSGTVNCSAYHPQYPNGPTPPSPPGPPGPHPASSTLSNGAIAGIVVGVGCAVVIAFAVIIYVRRRNTSTTDHLSEPLADQSTQGYAPMQNGETNDYYGGHTAPASTAGHTFV